MDDIFPPNEGQCLHVERCRLRIGDPHWPFADRHAEAIARHWARRRAERPKMFNGAVYVLRQHEIEGGTLTGAFLRTDFKTFLYWREHPALAAGAVSDSFGAALIRSAEGHMLLARQVSGHLNAGLVYPPSGLIDDNDAIDGAIDIDASIARELQEETGLEAAALTRTPGYFIILLPRQVTIAAEYRSPLPAAALRAGILEFIRGQPDPEIDDIVIVRTRADIERHGMPGHARALVEARMPP
jgi:8-oxo-dGTP pyrophosphatase MutT (NUDIX family)